MKKVCRRKGRVFKSVIKETHRRLADWTLPGSFGSPEAVTEDIYLLYIVLGTWP